jgi:predicted Zn-dependent protease
LALGAYDEAIALLEEAMADDAAFGTTVQTLATAYELAGNHEKAVETMALYMMQNPHYTLATYEATNPFLDPILRQQCADAMRAAGLPEG